MNDEGYTCYLCGEPVVLAPDGTGRCGCSGAFVYDPFALSETDDVDED